MNKITNTSSTKNHLQFLARRKALLTGIEQGEMAIKQGHIFTHEQAKEKLKKWLKF